MNHAQLRKLRQRQSLLRQRQARSARRGVLLMVVLAMLALFLLLGTAFLLTSGHFADSQKQSAKQNRVANQPSDLLERAMLQVLRDTTNSHSTVRWHSLLRDMYGADGFVGRVFTDPATTAAFASYAAATSGLPLGVTEGQLVDIYVLDREVLPGGVPEAGDAIRMERGNNGLAIDTNLATATNYYAGCLLTMIEGPAKGQSTRIVRHELVDLQIGPPRLALHRLRVMNFPKSNGEALTVGTSTKPLELIDLAGYAFVVNGRPHNGTGVGLNSSAVAGTPKLAALEAIVGTGGSGNYATDAVDYLPIALLPNSTTFDVGQFDDSADRNSKIWAQANGSGALIPLNVFSGTTLYPTFEGLGGSDESYDAVDYQNMFLASMPLTPRARGGYILDSGSAEISIPADQTLVPSGTFVRLDIEDVALPSFHRPDLINYWNHRLAFNSFVDPMGSNPAEAISAVLLPYGTDYTRQNSDGSNINIEIRDQIVALKRKFTMRPLREDHPGFTGSNPLAQTVASVAPSITVPAGMIAGLSQDVIGPWDVDNDGDGIADSIWVDLGDPVQETEDGRLYKPLYAFLIVDMDNKLDLNAHGSPAHMVNLGQPVNDLDPTGLDSSGNPVAGGNRNLVGGATSNLLPAGSGWGPPDVSLRPVLSPGIPTATAGDSLWDDYARLLAGNVAVDGFGRYRSEEWGKYGSFALFTTFTAGLTYNGNINTRDRHSQYDFEGYPERDTVRQIRTNGPYQFTQFTSPPDLHCRYATALGYDGQPISEGVWEGIIASETPVAGNALSQYRIPYPNGWAPLGPQDFSLLADDSPYEINISYEARKDVPQGTGGNDDAPFATAELERIVRGFDADVGTLPARLWNLVDAFDPVKYAQVVDNNPDAATPEELALAQTITAINRRSVTTDTSYAAVPSEQVPGYVTEMGADGAPGNIGVDDDGDNTPDNVQEVGLRVVDTNDPRYLAVGGFSDDFASLTGKSIGQARLVDVAWYRIQKSRAERGLQPYNFNHPFGIQELNRICAEILPPEVMRGEKMDINRPLGDGVDNPRQPDFLDNDDDGRYDEDDTNNGANPNLDNEQIGNGVVDEPLEAGEPYADINGNGQYDFGEPFINVDGSLDALAPNGNPAYTRSVNAFASDAAGELAAGDLSMGIDIGGGVFDRALKRPRPTYGDDQHLARQLQARHVYVMMMLLTDEHYIAPYDYNDPQVLLYLRKLAERYKAAGSMDDKQNQLAAQRQFSCREMAQYAVNSVDYRDADSACTPFEYDTNPWDGWNVTYEDPTGQNDPITVPIDSDPSTVENAGEFIDWDRMATLNVANGGRRLIGTTADVTLLADGTFNNAPLVRQTRDIVWGAERPELLITETMAWHDRRTEDESSTNTQANPHGTLWDGVADQTQPDAAGHYPDDDLDQSLRPQGSALIELYNPWPFDGNRPPDLYSRFVNEQNAPRAYDPNEDGDIDVDGTPNELLLLPSDGVELGRLSTEPDADGNRSPVWRIAVVEEHPEYRNYAGIDSNPVAIDPPTSSAMTPEQEAIAIQYRSGATDRLPFTNIDWSGMYTARVEVNNNYIPIPTSELKPRQWTTKVVTVDDPKNVPGNLEMRVFSKPYPYIEREFYFTSGPGTTAARREYTDLELYAGLRTAYNDLKRSNQGLRMPFGYIQLDKSQSFSLVHRFLSSANEDEDRDVLISPLLPGRYGIIGRRGPNYDFVPNPTFDRNGYDGRYILVVGRAQQAGNSQDLTTDTFLRNRRRFEFWPSVDPNIQQFLSVGNGAGRGRAVDATNRRGVDFVFADQLRYLTDADNDGNPGSADGSANLPIDIAENNGDMLPDAEGNAVMPVVVFPVDEFNVSEPIWGYEVRQDELEEFELDRYQFEQAQAGGEGRFVSGVAGQPAYFDNPFDVEPELMAVGTTPNYRVLHLQRLANPNLPWNPEPTFAAWDDTPWMGNSRVPPRTYVDADGTDSGVNSWQHDPRLPVNPYITVDSSSIDLVAFNGVCSDEANSKTKPPRQLVFDFSSHERGNLARLIGIEAAKNLRNLLAQEPPRRINDDPNWDGRDNFRDLKDSLVIDTTRQPADPTNSGRNKIEENQVNWAMEHSFGMANESYGDVYYNPTLVGAAVGAPTGLAIGMPRPDMTIDVNDTRNNTTDDVASASTFTTLAWANRPYISAGELMQVPRSSSATLLRDYSVPDPAAAAPTNAYTDPGLVMPVLLNTPATADAVKTNKYRYDFRQSYFGHLLNFFQSSGTSATWVANQTNDLIPVGAPHLHRLFDYVHTPSRFSHTDTMLPPSLFNTAGSALRGATTVSSTADPRWGLSVPFNRVDNYSEPGRINLNTVVGRHIPASTSTFPRSWSEVYDGLMHRLRDGRDTTLGHLGPAWRDVVLSRRGYFASSDRVAGIPDSVAQTLDNTIPTMIANPFRAPNEGDLVPLNNLRRNSIDATMQRRHNYLPGDGQLWGNANVDDDGNGWVDDVSEAGYGGTDAPDIDPALIRHRHPLFSAGAFGPSVNSPAIDALRNSGMQLSPLTRLENLTSTRSGVYAVWVTVGYFEVSKAPNFDDTSNTSTRDKFVNQVGGTSVPNYLDRARSLYNAVYPEGYQLGKELGSEIGEAQRQRAFYLIDRTRPVGFLPGSDLNVEDAILLRRRIE